MGKTSRFRFSRLRHWPALLLSALLQLAPLLRMAAADAVLAVSPVVAVLRWVVGALAVTGGYHTVSGATGLTVTQNNQVTERPSGTNGLAMGFRVSIASEEHGTAKAYSVSGLPAGLQLASIALGVVSGVPVESGTFNALVIGWEFADQTGDNASFLLPISVMDPPPVILTPPASLTVDEGAAASLRVVANGPGLTYRWIKNDIELSRSIPGATNDMLTFNPVKPSNAGDYKVRVSNGGGAVISSVATLVVNPATTGPPQITALTVSPAAAHAGETVRLEATVQGAPPLTLQWLRAGAPLPAATNVALVLTNAAVTDSGTYSMVVTNPGGSATNGPVELTFPPLRLEHPRLRDGTVTLRFNTLTGRSYRLETAVTPGGVWLPGEPFVGTGTEASLVTPLEASSRAFRLRVE